MNSTQTLAMMVATAIVATGLAIWAARAARGHRSIARSLAARGIDGHQIARHLRVSQDVVGLLATPRGASPGRQRIPRAATRAGSKVAAAGARS